MIALAVNLGQPIGIIIDVDSGAGQSRLRFGVSKELTCRVTALSRAVQSVAGIGDGSRSWLAVRFT